VLKAVASSLRLEVLNLLLDRGPLSYTEIMNTLRLNPSRDAGRFAYHLKFLLKADLIEPDVETKKYRLTDLGRMLVDVTETIEERVFKRRKMMVRTSRLAMEEFDRNKIAEALVKEASVPLDLAQKIARETEGRLQEVKAKYLTAPLIREFVNAILMEKGLEEYRHKLTRLGLPVYDVTQLIKSAGAQHLSVEAVHCAAGDAVIEEYTLLNILPRDIADAHLSGSLHLSNLGCWVLKPREFFHDLRFFLQNGLSLGKPELSGAPFPPPKSFESALLVVLALLRATATEVSGEQTIDYFNVFLAPFARGVSTERIRESMRFFIFSLSQALSEGGSPIEASLGLELMIPPFLKEKDAVGPNGQGVGFYTDFEEESRLINSLLLEAMLELGRNKPIFQPSLIVKIRPEAFQSKEGEALLYEAHKLAAERGLPYFANLCFKEQENTSYTATGCRLSSDWKGDWELDTVRTSCIDNVLINLPRVSYDAEGSHAKFNELLDEQLEMALRALEIKYLTIRQRLREGLLPFLTQKAGGDQYFRLENSTRLIGFVGLNEASESFTGKPLIEDSKSLSFAEGTMKRLLGEVRKSAKRPETRPVLSMIPSGEAAKRLAELDVERYGLARVRVRGGKEQPVYTDMVAVPPQSSAPFLEVSKVEESFHQLSPGGHLAKFELADKETDPNELMSTTRQLVTTSRLGLYTYSRHLTFCARCQKTFFGLQPKCLLCGSVDAVTFYKRLPEKYRLMTTST